MCRCVRAHRVSTTTRRHTLHHTMLCISVCTYLSFLVSDIYIFTLSSLGLPPLPPPLLLPSTAFHRAHQLQLARTLAKQATVLGTGGIMYGGGNVMSGPQDSLVDLLMPSKTEDLDKVCTIHRAHTTTQLPHTICNTPNAKYVQAKTCVLPSHDIFKCKIGPHPPKKNVPVRRPLGAVALCSPAQTLS